MAQTVSAPAATPPPRRWRRALFAILAMALGLGTALLALELFLRAATPAWLDQRMAELSAGESAEVVATDRNWPVVLADGGFRQFVVGSVFTARHYEYRHQVSIDELGGRATQHPPTAKHLVPFLGDSFVFGLGVADDETFVTHLANEAADTPAARNLRLLNLGVPGSALVHHLDMLTLRHDELGRPPRYVICVFMGNDLANLVAADRQHDADADGDGDAGTRTAQRDQTWLFRANVFVYHHPWLKRLYSLQFLRQPALRILNRGERGFMDPVFEVMRTDGPHLERGLGLFAAQLQRLRELTEQLDFEVLFILIPDVHQLDPDRRSGRARSLGLAPERLDPQAVTLGLARLLDEGGFRVIELGPCLSSTQVAPLYYSLDTHFTAAGHAKTASCLSDQGVVDWLGAD